MPKGTLGGFKGDFWKYGDSNGNMEFYPKQIPKKIEESFHFFEQKQKIKISDKIVIFGSCFSEHLRSCLIDSGFSNIENCLIPAGLNNIFAIRQILQYIINNDSSYNKYAYNKKYELNTWKGDRTKIKNFLLNSDLIILTVGLAEYWEDIKTGGKFWMGIPENMFDKNIHKLKIATPEEIKNEMNIIIELLDKKNVMFSICPVPLNATFTSEKCVVANSISKSICRTGFHLFYSSINNPNIFYLPIYELCYYIGIYYKIDIFDSNISRHLSKDFLKIIAHFFKYLFLKN